MIFLSCHGPLGVDQVAVLTHRGQDRRHMKKQDKNKHKWQEVTKDNKAFISRSARETEWGAHRVSASSTGETVVGVSPARSGENGRQDRADPSSIHQSISPGGEEGSKTWRDLTTTAPQTRTQTSLLTWDKKTASGERSANHTWGCGACLQITLKKGKWHSQQLQLEREDKFALDTFGCNLWALQAFWHSDACHTWKMQTSWKTTGEVSVLKCQELRAVTENKRLWLY